MKLTTRIHDLAASVANDTAKSAVKILRDQAVAKIDIQPIDFPVLTRCVEDLVKAQELAASACADFMGIPKTRRDLADLTRINARVEASSLANRLGGTYSGETKHTVCCLEYPSARIASATTKTSVGEKYSRSCPKYKTNAEHIISLDLAGIPLLADNAELKAASNRDGLPLIALYPDGRAVWVLRKNKSIVSEAGFIAYDSERRICYHHTESLAQAERGLAKKIAAFDRERATIAAAAAQRESDRLIYRFSPAGIAERRTKLVARLCSGATASLSDALELGYCEPGIRAFQQDFGIGNTASLPDLVRTGNPSAIRLALKIARKITSAASR